MYPQPHIEPQMDRQHEAACYKGALDLSRTVDYVFGWDAHR
jgi:hypothetical protein